MTAKEYLSQIYKLDRRINMMERKKESMRQALYGRATNYETDGSQHVPSGNSVEDAIHKVLDYEEQINVEIDKLVDLRLEIEKSIKQIADEKQREIIERRYLLCQKWEVIAVEMCIDLRWIYRLHTKALLTIESH